MGGDDTVHRRENLIQDMVNAVNKLFKPMGERYPKVKLLLDISNAGEVKDGLQPERLIQYLMIEWKTAHWFKIMKEETKNKLPSELGDVIQVGTSFEELLEQVTEH